MSIVTISDQDSNTETLLNCCGNEFFDKVENRIKTKIPVIVRNILAINDFDCAVVFSKFNNDTISELENYIKNVLHVDMLHPAETLDQYLGRYVKCQHKFVLSTGQKAMINVIAETCLKHQMVSSTPIVRDRLSPNVSEHTGVLVPKPHNGQEKEIIENYGRVEQLNFFNYIGSLMVTVLNDAKRLTLSGWYWPARQVSAEIANNFKVNGTHLTDPVLNYVNPTNHAEFLNSIVQNDIGNLSTILNVSLAISLRVDGSVDITQDHNLYVMANIVTKDTKMKTIFLGFSVPENEENKDDGTAAAAYFECIKTLVNKIIPWEQFLKLTTLFVTDGESLNSGSVNGLWERMKRARRTSNSPSIPMFSIWCVDHIITLAWKSVC